MKNHMQEKKERHADDKGVKKTHVKRSPLVGKKWPIVAAFIVLLVVIAGIVLWLATKTTNQKSTDVQEERVIPYDLYLSDILEKTKAESTVATKVTSLGGHSREGLLIYDFAPHKVEGAEFKSLPMTGNGLGMSFADAAMADQAIKDAITVLTGAGFSQVSDKTSDAGGLASQNTAVLASYAIYKSDDTVCSLAHLTSKSTPAEHGLAVGCAEISTYVQAAKVTKPFYEAFGDSSSQKTSMVMSPPVITNGAVGTQRAIVHQKPADQSTAGDVALYYRGYANGTWRYLTTAANGTVPCAAFITDEQKSAYKGYGCYDEAQKKLVSLGV